MRRFFSAPLHFARPRVLAALASLCLGAAVASDALAAQSGFQSMTVAGEDPIPVLLFYPTSAAARPIPMGPWTVEAAPGAPADQALKGLIVLSHGTGGSEIGHHQLATGLASAGYLVASLRHPHDNWQDRSMVGSLRYFTERPAQASRVIDAVLAHPTWAPRLPAGRIGALGHSAGGFTVLALAGAEALPQRAASHCRQVQDDPGFCSLARRPDGMGGAPAAPAAPGASAAPAAPTASAAAQPASMRAADPRVKAIVALAPMAVVLSEASLAQVQVPARIYVAGQDRVLAGPYHGDFAARHIPGAQLMAVPQAGHFAFMSKPAVSMPSPAGDPAEDPAGFDRAAFQQRLLGEVVAYFDQQLR